MSIEDIADGLALWQEHRPQTAEDWIRVAERCIADPDYDITQSAPIFQALVTVVAAVPYIGPPAGSRGADT